MDEALASEIVFRTFAGRSIGFRRGARGEGPRTLVGGARLFLPIGKGGPSLRELATGLQRATVSTLGTMVGSARGGPPE